MSVLKYKDPVTGEVKKVGSPSVATYTKAEVDTKLNTHTGNKNNPHGVTREQIGAAPAYTYGTEDIEEGSASPYENGHIHFIYEP